jgi:pimeloyl-ACP methyl ester carboxylesterase
MPKVLVAGSYNRAVWNRELLTPYAEAFATPDDAAGPVNWYRGAFRDALRRPRRRMTRLAMPVLVIWGVHDQFLGRGLVEPESLLGTLAYGNVADVIDVADAGHFVQNEAPDAVNEALLAWLGQRDGAPA